MPRQRLPDESELFSACVKEWNREAIIAALHAIASELAMIARRGSDADRRQLDDLRSEVVSQIEKMSGDASARPGHGFAERLTMRGRELGLDSKRLLGVATNAVYGWRMP